VIINPHVKQDAVVAAKREEAPVASAEVAPLPMDNPYFVSR
jgi:hypothetical protein